MLALALVVCSTACGVAKVKRGSLTPVFRELYEVAGPVRQMETPSGARQGVRVTLSADGMSLVDWVRYVADRARVSVVVSEGLEARSVTGEFTDVEVSTALSMVARRLGVEASYSSGVFYLGELKPEDRALLVRRVPRMSQQELREAVQVLLSQNGRVAAQSDGLVVVGDRVEILQRVSLLLDQIESADSGTWVVQVYLTRSVSRLLSQMGADVVPSADLAASFVRAAEGGTESALAASAALDAVLVFDYRSEGTAVVAEPLFVLEDGARGEVRDGDELRIPQRTVTDQGTVTTTGYERIQTGFVCSVEVRDMGEGRARLGLEVEASAVVGFAGEAELPQVNRQAFQTQAVVRSGGVYLLGSLELSSEFESRTGFGGWSKLEDDRERSVDVWARAYRVGARGGVVGTFEPKESEG